MEINLVPIITEGNLTDKINSSKADTSQKKLFCIKVVFFVWVFNVDESSWFILRKNIKKLRCPEHLRFCHEMLAEKSRKMTHTHELKKLQTQNKFTEWQDASGAAVN